MMFKSDQNERESFFLFSWTFTFCNFVVDFLRFLFFVISSATKRAPTLVKNEDKLQHNDARNALSICESRELNISYSNCRAYFHECGDWCE